MSTQKASNWALDMAVADWVSVASVSPVATGHTHPPTACGCIPHLPLTDESRTYNSKLIPVTPVLVSKHLFYL